MNKTSETYVEVNKMIRFLREHYSANNLNELESAADSLKQEVDFYNKELEVPFEQRTTVMFQRYHQTALDYHCILQRISEINKDDDWITHFINAQNQEACIYNFLKKNSL